MANTDPSLGEIAPSKMPLGGTRAEATQRLQLGLFGIFAMVLLIGLASAIGSQADIAERNAVPEAAPTTEPSAPAPQRDPLVDAGVVPDIPLEPGSQPSAPPNVVPDIEPGGTGETQIGEADGNGATP